MKGSTAPAGHRTALSGEAVMDREQTAPPRYRSRRCTAISIQGLRCQDGLGHTGGRDKTGRRAVVQHHAALGGRVHTWPDD